MLDELIHHFDLLGLLVLTFTHFPLNQCQTWWEDVPLDKISCKFLCQRFSSLLYPVLQQSWSGDVLVSSYQSIHHIDGLVQDCSNFSALAMELLQSCTKPSICDNTVNFTVDVVLWTELCPHCIFQTSSQILFIFIDLIDQLQKNYILSLWCFFLSFEIWSFPEFLNSWLSTSCSGFLWMSSYIRIFLIDRIFTGPTHF